VQLPNFIHRSENSHWPEVQDGMRRTLALRNTGMAVTIDIGDPNDIHPANKQDVGKRLARVGRAAAYGEPITSTGPLFTRAIREGAKLRVFFDQTGGALKTRDGAPLVKAFEIAWGPGPFRVAEARIDGDTILVSVPDGREPTVLRYAWGGNPETNLVNTLDLPASPFRAAVR
jgi:sialate O-acetylesterase